MKPLLFSFIYLFFMRLLHKQRQDYCLLLLNLCNLLQFAYTKTIWFAYALIITKKFSPPFLLYLAAPVCVIMKCTTITRNSPLNQKYHYIPDITIKTNLEMANTCFENMWANIAKNLFWDKNNFNHWQAVWCQSYICWKIFELKISARNPK